MVARGRSGEDVWPEEKGKGSEKGERRVHLHGGIEALPQFTFLGGLCSLPRNTRSTASPWKAPGSQRTPKQA